MHNLESRVKSEQTYQLGKATEAISNVIDALGVACRIANPSENNNALDAALIEAQQLAYDIRKLV